MVLILGPKVSVSVSRLKCKTAKSVIEFYGIVRTGTGMRWFEKPGSNLGRAGPGLRKSGSVSAPGQQVTILFSAWRSGREFRSRPDPGCQFLSLIG